MVAAEGFWGCGAKGNISAPHREAPLENFEAPVEKFTILGLLPAITRYNSHFARPLAETRGAPHQNFAGADAPAAPPFRRPCILPLGIRVYSKGQMLSFCTIYQS